MQITIKNLTYLSLFTVFLTAWWFTASVINPQLHYYLQQSAFLTDFSFFKSYLKYPGGLADYFSEFIAQFFYFNALGSLLIVTTGALIGILSIQLIERVTGKIKLVFSAVGIILLLSIIIQSNYYYPFYASVRLLIAAAFVLIFTLLSDRFTRWRYPVSFLLAILLFYLSGGAALFVYTLSVILLQIHFYGNKKDWVLHPFLALFAVVLPYLSYRYVFLVELPLVYNLTHSKSPEVLYYAPDYKLYALYATIPLYIGMAILYNRYQLRAQSTPVKAKPNKTASNKKGTKKQDVKKVDGEGTSKPGKPASPVIWITGQLIAFAILAGISIHYSLDKTVKNKLLVSYYASRSDWEKVLEATQNVEGYDLFINIEYNRALANTGKLPDRLFSYAQLAGPSGMFVDGKVTSDIPFICCDQYYELGFMHEAQHWAFEGQTLFPHSPRLLKRMVQINLVNGRYALAEKFLYHLKDNLLYQDWVEGFQKYIDDTTLVSKDKELSWKRKCEPLENFTAGNAYLKLTKLLEANSGNKMAFDYLLCSVLLDGDLATYKNLLNKYPHLVQSPLPRAYDEALVLYYYMTRQRPEPGDIKFSEARQKHFFSFIKAMKPYGSNWQSARQSLAKDFGDTYWYYLKCLSPQVTNAQIKRQ